MTLAGRWGSLQDAQLARFEAQSEPLTPYDRGCLNALAIAADDEAIRLRIEMVRDRETRRAQDAQARQRAKLERQVMERLDDVIDRAIARGGL